MKGKATPLGYFSRSMFWQIKGGQTRMWYSISFESDWPIEYHDGWVMNGISEITWWRIVPFYATRMTVQHSSLLEFFHANVFGRIDPSYHRTCRILSQGKMANNRRFSATMTPSIREAAAMKWLKRANYFSQILLMSVWIKVRFMMHRIIKMEAKGSFKHSFYSITMLFWALCSSITRWSLLKLQKRIPYFIIINK